MFTQSLNTNVHRRFTHKSPQTGNNQGVLKLQNSQQTAVTGTQKTAGAAESLQSCLTPCDPTDGSPQAPRPWDSPGKHTGGGCHSFLQHMKVKSLSRVQLLATPQTAAHQAPRPWDSPGKSAGAAKKHNPLTQSNKQKSYTGWKANPHKVCTHCLLL